MRGNETGWSPWRHLRQHHPDVQVIEAELEPGVRGCTDHYRRIIWLDSRLLCREKRATLAHELGHLQLDVCAGIRWVPAPEWRVDRWAALRLITLPALLQGFGWTTNLDELAEELFVDRHTLSVRLRCLTDDEQDAVMAAIERKWVAA